MGSNKCPEGPRLGSRKRLSRSLVEWWQGWGPASVLKDLVSAQGKGSLGHLLLKCGKGGFQQVTLRTSFGSRKRVSGALVAWKIFGFQQEACKNRNTKKSRTREGGRNKAKPNKSEAVIKTGKIEREREGEDKQETDMLCWSDMMGVFPMSLTTCLGCSNFSLNPWHARVAQGGRPGEN